jgi:hypothetical protein
LEDAVYKKYFKWIFQVSYKELQEGDYFISNKYDRNYEAYVVVKHIIGEDYSYLAHRKGGGTRFFNDNDKVIKINKAEYEDAFVDDVLYNAFQKSGLKARQA